MGRRTVAGGRSRFSGAQAAGFLKKLATRALKKVWAATTMDPDDEDLNRRDIDQYLGAPPFLGRSGYAHLQQVKLLCGENGERTFCRETKCWGTTSLLQLQQARGAPALGLAAKRALAVLAAEQLHLLQVRIAGAAQKGRGAEVLIDVAPVEVLVVRVHRRCGPYLFERTSGEFF